MRISILFGVGLAKTKERILSKICDDSGKGKQMVVAIANRSKDYEMLRDADISIVFGDLKKVKPMLYEVCDYAICDESKLIELLNRIRRGDG